MHQNLLRAMATLTAVALASPALGEGGAGGVYTKDTYPDALPSRPLTLPSGTFELRLPVTVNMSKDLFGKPVSVGPSLFYGVTQDVSVGIYHPVGLCLSGQENGCEKVYNDVGAAAIVNLYRNGNYQLVANAAFQASRLADPVWLQGIVGLGGKGTFGPAALAWNAAVAFGLTNRDTGNKEVLALQLNPQVEVAHGVALQATIGLDAPFDGFSDFYAIPVGFGLEVTPVHNVDVGVDFTFTNLLGKNSSADFREGTVYGRFRF